MLTKRRPLLTALPAVLLVGSLTLVVEPAHGDSHLEVIASGLDSPRGLVFNVFRVVPGHPPTVFAAGFTNIIDITFDAQGRLLVLEIAAHGLTSGDPTGALEGVEPGGSITVIAQAGLIYPTSVAIGPDGAFYISNNGTTIGGGQVVRLRP